ncbi:hypothetical protein GEMRC1_004252 [Eukaryota sp. GEM-RC1]
MANYLDVNAFLQTVLSPDTITKHVQLLDSASSFPSHGQSCAALLKKLESIVTTSYRDPSVFPLLVSISRALTLLADQKTFEASKTIEILTMLIKKSNPSQQLYYLKTTLEILLSKAQSSHLLDKRILQPIINCLIESQEVNDHTARTLSVIIDHFLSPTFLTTQSQSVLNLISFLLNKFPRPSPNEPNLDQYTSVVLGSVSLSKLAKLMFELNEEEEEILSDPRVSCSGIAQESLMYLLKIVPSPCLGLFTDSLVQHLKSVSQSVDVVQKGKIVEQIFEILDKIKTFMSVSVYQKAWENAFL